MEAWKERIYNTLLGLYEKDKGIPGVENLFAEGKRCDLLYSEIYEAGERINRRLGTQEDPDVEIILNGFQQIAKNHWIQNV